MHWPYFVHIIVIFYQIFDTTHVRKCEIVKKGINYMPRGVVTYILRHCN